MPIRPGQAKGAYTGADGGGGGGGSVDSVGANTPLASTGGATPIISMVGLSSFGSPGQVPVVNPDGTAFEWGDNATNITPQQAVEAMYPAWDSIIVYPINYFVQQGGIVFMSKVAGNIGSSPSSSPGAWHQFGATPDDTHTEAMKFLGDLLNPWE